MPIVFPDIDSLEAYVDANITANGIEAITGPINNNALNGCIEFIRQSPLNWAKASIESSGGDIIASTPVVVFSSVTPDSLTWGDNIYNEFVFINMTVSEIPLSGSLVYYNLLGQAIDNIPPNTAITVFKAANDLWVLGDNLGTSSDIAQKQPLTFKVGTTTGAPTIGANTWTLSSFLNSYVVLFVNRTIVDLMDANDGNPYITKALATDTLTISNYFGGWNDGDVLTFILITP